MACAIRDALTDGLRKKPWTGAENHFAGHCYVASEAAYHLTGAALGPWRPQFMYVGDEPHWFLRHERGYVWDPTGPQFKTSPNYDEGKGKGFLTKQPSKRAAVLIARVVAVLAANA